MRTIGPYVVTGEIARGGSAVVYRGRDPATNRELAIKVLVGATRNDVQRRRFQREVQALQKIVHVNVVRVHDSGFAAGQPFIAMELIEGPTLQYLLDREGAMEAREAVRIVLALARGVHHAHTCGVLHRDIKPDNVLVRDGAPVLTDFGLAKELDPTGSRLSHTGTFMGTPGFWPPEQARGEIDAIGPRSDVYGLGATLYALLTRLPPLAGGSLIESLEAVDTAPLRLSKLVPHVDRALDRICMKCLAKDPDKRYGSADELGDALEDYLDLAAQPPRRGRALALAAVVTTLAVAAALSPGEHAAPDPRVVPTPLSPIARPDAPVLLPEPVPPEPPPPPNPEPGDVQLVGRFVDVTETAGIIPENEHRRAAWADLDGDGYPDLAVGDAIYLNQRDGTFQLIDQRGGGPGPLAADFNNDGHVDLYYHGNKGILLHGDGAGGFKRAKVVANPSRPRSAAAAAADFDGDGWLDIYVANYEIDPATGKSAWFKDVLLRNREGTFEVAWEAPKMPARGVSICDFDADGDPDVYVSQFRLYRNLLWVNDGDLVEQGEARGCAGTDQEKVADGPEGQYPAVSGFTIASSWADFDNDGVFDLFVANYMGQDGHCDHCLLLQNSGPPGYRFRDRSDGGGVPAQLSYGSPATADFDNDGWVDIYVSTPTQSNPGETGRLLRNRGSWRVEDVTGVAGLEGSGFGYQVAWADFDNDGRMDLMAGDRLYRNETEVGAWIAITLRGKDCNRSAVGAEARLRLGERTLIRQVQSGTGTGNQSQLTLHFGLGAATEPVEVEVRWPCGKTATRTVALNQRVDWREE